MTTTKKTPVLLTLLFAGLLATFLVATPASAAVDKHRCVGVQPISDRAPDPYDAGGTDAYARCRRVGTKIVNVQVEFHARDEIFVVDDTWPDGARAWGEIVILGTGASYWRSNTTATGKTEFNMSIQEGTRVKIRACQGGRTDKTKYGCSAWAYATA